MSKRNLGDYPHAEMGSAYDFPLIGGICVISVIRDHSTSTLYQ